MITLTLCLNLIVFSLETHTCSCTNINILFNKTIVTNTTRTIFRNTLDWFMRFVNNRANTRPRIVGGTNAALGEAPWQVALWDFNVNPSFPFCGGVIIDKYHILTAAHCAVVSSVQSTKIDYNRLVTTPTTAQLNGVRIRRIVINAAFNPSTLDNDIALISLFKPLTLGQIQAMAVTLPAQGSDPAAGTSVQVSGWGLTSENGVQTSTLQIVTLEIVARSVCQTDYNAIMAVTDNMVCAGVPAGGKDSCNGDSGGPMTSNGVLVGIVSWGVGCGEPGFPGVYTRVGNYVNWINENILNENCITIKWFQFCF